MESEQEPAAAVALAVTDLPGASPMLKPEVVDEVLDALEQALYDRDTYAPLVHHSDRGSQYLAIRYTERLLEAGIESSVGSRGDAYDNALAETINGLYKTEVIYHLGPWKGLEAVELATLEWVAWYNMQRLMGPLGYVPPAEYEAQFHRAQAELAVGALNYYLGHDLADIRPRTAHEDVGRTS